MLGAASLHSQLHAFKWHILWYNKFFPILSLICMMQKSWSGNGLPWFSFNVINFHGSLGQRQAVTIKAYVHNVISKENRNQSLAAGTKGNISLSSCTSHPSTEENSADISPRLCMTALQRNHSLALASLWPPHAQVKLAMRWMHPRTCTWQFCSSAERKMRPHVPVQSSQEQ